MRPAVFLDRDGTLIEDVGYLASPSGVALIPGVSEALHRLAAAGFILTVVSNQSGIARGLFDAAAVDAVNAEIARQLGPGGATIARWACCPHLPDAGCRCRKPGTQLHREAADALGIDLGRSWCVGDRMGDVRAATSFGGRGILVMTGEGAGHIGTARAEGVAVAADLLAASAIICDASAQRPSQ
jgi:D-glycero-D-manno-heptose 1,7-bisphosphate phosphatase